MNVIDITLTCQEHNAVVNCYHNQQLIQTLTANQGPVRICIDAVNASNELTLDHTSQYNVCIVSLSMFEMGQEKLQYLGVYKNNAGQSWNSHVIEAGGQWSLQYQYPVFSWLHTTLNLGWLIKPDV
jgi:hypothetical protein